MVGLKKNLFLIANYFSQGINVNIISANKDKKKFFNKDINFICPKTNFLNKKNRFYKTIFCFYLLLFFYLKNKNFFDFIFSSKYLCNFFSFIFGINIITRSNTAPPGWSSNIIKRYIFKIF